MFITILIFVVILGILVFVHEFGHFIVAKKSGMKVLEFGFGFPPRLFGFQKADGRWRMVWGHRNISQTQPTSPSYPSPDLGREAQDVTIYSVNWIPLGGFVKILGENNEYADHPQSFINKPFWLRLLTLIAGVIMNVILAWVIISVLLIIGLQAQIESPDQIPKGATLKNPQVAIEKLVEGKPAALAGLQPGDIILEIDDEEFVDYLATRKYISSINKNEIKMEVKRIDQELTFLVKPEIDPRTQEKFIGVELANIGNITFPAHLAFIKGAQFTGVQLLNIANGLYGLFAGRVSLASLGGPVKIAQLTGQVARQGITSLMQFIAFLSLNLALLNFLPFPALDGGRVLFLIIEKIRGQRNNPKVEQWVNAAGFAFLILLMVLVTIKDVKGF